MDENNQYGQAMTKPLPYGCIEKKKKSLKSRRTFRTAKNCNVRRQDQSFIYC